MLQIRTLMNPSHPLYLVANHIIKGRGFLENEPLRVTEEHRQREKVLDKQPTLASSLPVLWV